MQELQIGGTSAVNLKFLSFRREFSQEFQIQNRTGIIGFPVVL
jgi:hypothetical protein